MRKAEPNRGHRAVATLVRRGKVSAVITQNIDGLHQASGVPAEQVIELHGNTTYAHCLTCGQRYEIEVLRAAFERDGSAPRCTWCDGLVKTATISFGQQMPTDAMRRAEAETLAADLFLTVGSSLVVYPAAGFPELAKHNGATLVIVNRDPTGLDALADLVVNRMIGDTLGAAVGGQLTTDVVGRNSERIPPTQVSAVRPSEHRRQVGEWPLFVYDAPNGRAGLVVTEPISASPGL